MDDLRTRAWALLDAVLDLTPAEQAAFLDRACGGDAELRAAVDRLLAADAAAAPLLDGPALALATGVMEPAPAVAGRVIGPYRLVRELGRGGMGVVYLAERTDLPLQVAVKLVRGELAAPEHGARFAVEQRVLARLTHLHIARLLDAGLTGDGTPYVAMEYVDGMPIDAYCDAHRLTVEARLALFRAVCDAVAYAHRNLVVHRDLKPSNVLVTTDGTVKLLDFGIAKLLGEGDLSVTRTAARPMTPEYAAPEQVRGDPVTTAADVYGLGVLLYELLAGRRPYRFAGRSLADVERVVLESEPSRPSVAVGRVEETDPSEPPSARRLPADIAAARRLSPERLVRRLAGDLDTIVGKALAKAPERRYASAEQLGEDVARHLAGHPVSARPDSWLYRTRKFVRRHRVAVAGAATLVVVAGSAGALIVQERNRAREESAAARRASDFLTSLLLAGGMHAVDRATTVTELLDLGVARIDTLADDPALQARILTALGRAYSERDEYARARRILERALALQRTRPDDYTGLTTTLWALARVLSEQGDLTRAEPLARELLARKRQADAPDSSIVESLVQLGDITYYGHDFRGAERTFREALALARKLDHPTLPLAFALSGLGMSLNEQGRAAEAEPALRESVLVLERIGGRDYPPVFFQMALLGDVLRDQGRLAEAEAVTRHAVEGTRRVFGPASVAFLNQLEHLARIRELRGDRGESAALLREAVAIHRRTDRPSEGRTAWLLAKLGGVLMADARPGDAEPVLREAVRLYETRAGTSTWTTIQLALARGELGSCLVALRRVREAEPLLRASEQTLRGALPANDPRVQSARARVAALDTAHGASAASPGIIRRHQRSAQRPRAPSDR